VLTMHGRVLIVGAMCALAALFAVITPEQADAQGTAAATAALHCGHSQIASAKRSLSSANRTLLQKKCAQAHKSLTTVSYLRNPKHRWMLAPRYKKWWQVPDKQWRQVVRHSRAALRYHQHRLVVVVRQIQSLLPNPGLELLKHELVLASGTRVCIAGVETPGSSHPYTQLNPTGKYKGKYQYDDGTWQAARNGAQEFYHVAISTASRADYATSWAQDVVTSFAVLHPDLLGWNPWAECR
jgi:hypothetical protein